MGIEVVFWNAHYFFSTFFAQLFCSFTLEMILIIYLHPEDQRCLLRHNALRDISRKILMRKSHQVWNRFWAETIHIRHGKPEKSWHLSAFSSRVRNNSGICFWLYAKSNDGIPSWNVAQKWFESSFKTNLLFALQSHRLRQTCRHAFWGFLGHRIEILK